MATVETMMPPQGDDVLMSSPESVVESEDTPIEVEEEEKVATATEFVPVEASKPKDNVTTVTVRIRVPAKDTKLGMGLKKDIKDGTFKVDSMKPGCLLSDSKIQVGDTLISVNDQTCANLTNSAVASLLKSTSSTDGWLTVTVEHNNVNPNVGNGDSQLLVEGTSKTGDFMTKTTKTTDDEDATVSLGDSEEDSEDEQPSSSNNNSNPTAANIDLQQKIEEELAKRDKEKQEEVLAKSMELNESFMALENMRKANLEVEFGGKAIPNIHLFHQFCSTCLHEQKKREEEILKKGDYTARQKFLKGVVSRVKAQRKHPLCLVCTSPVCRRHCCPDFKKEKITVCGDCAPLFTMDFVVEALSHDDEARRQECMNRMIDSYDRALLMLRYSNQYIDEIADALESNSRKNDHIGLGSSMIGLTSGFTGVASVAAQFVLAATVLSPAGPPLLVASILFGASAAAASTGTEAMTYYSEPNQLANKILALHDLVHSLLGVTTVLRESIARGNIDARHYIDMNSGKRTVAYWKSRLPPQPTPGPTSPVDEEEEDAEDVTPTKEEKDSEALEEAPQIKPEKSKKEESVEEKETKHKPSLADIDDDDEEAPLPVDEKHVPSLADIDDEEEEAPAEEKPIESTGSMDADIVVEEEPKTVAAKVKSSINDIDGDDDEPETLEKDALDDKKHGINESEDDESACGEKELDEAELKKPEETKALTIAPSNQRTAMTRATTNAMKFAQFASVACVMLSFTTIILETKNMRDTLRSLRAGSPCEKAKKLREIKKEIDALPETDELAKECESYMRSRPPTNKD